MRERVTGVLCACQVRFWDSDVLLASADTRACPSRACRSLLLAMVERRGLVASVLPPHLPTSLSPPTSLPPYLPTSLPPCISPLQTPIPILAGSKRGKNIMGMMQV